MIKRSDVVPGIYKSMCVCSDHFVGGSPSTCTLHDVNNQDSAPSLKLEVETVAKSTLQARYKSRGGCRIVERKTKYKKNLARKRVRNFWNTPLHY